MTGNTYFFFFTIKSYKYLRLYLFIFTLNNCQVIYDLKIACNTTLNLLIFFINEWDTKLCLHTILFNKTVYLTGSTGMLSVRCISLPSDYSSLSFLCHRSFQPVLFPFISYLPSFSLWSLTEGNAGNYQLHTCLHGRKDFQALKAHMLEARCSQTHA